MDSTAIHWLTERVDRLEKERNDWREIAYRLTMPYHDDNCEYGVQCSYCVAMEKASKR